MFSGKSFAILLSLGLTALAVEHEARQQSRAPVLTAVRVFQTLVDTSPFLVPATTTIVWTQSPSITEAQPAPTEVPANIPVSVAASLVPVASAEAASLAVAAAAETAVKA